MRDPVCGKHLEKEAIKATSTYLECRYVFCSAKCQMEFDLNPREYLSESALGA
jgi:YHS domain-containing protein